MFRFSQLLSVSIVSMLSALTAVASLDLTSYSWDECQGSARPYPAPERLASYPDSLTPVMINHVGRHGARFASSPAHTTKLLKALREAEYQGTLTGLGQELMQLTEAVVKATGDRWGHLDSLGEAEQQGIARRMFEAYPHLFDGQVSAVSSYVPRCVMSMYEFVHQIALLRHDVETSAESGPRFTPILRFFQDSEVYRQTVGSERYKDAMRSYEQSVITMDPIRRVVGQDFTFDADSLSVAMEEYSVLAGLQAIDMKVDIDRYFSREEYNRLWAIGNMRQYLDRTATELSDVPAVIARPLLKDILDSFDRFMAGDSTVAPVTLRFGHAETLMPLLSLMRLPGCYYMTDDLATVDRHWRNFDIVPMAANLQMVLFRSATGRYYLRVDVNEHPVALLPGNADLYTPWPAAHGYLTFLAG